MAKMASLHADGVTDLLSYQAGIDFERERIIKAIKAYEKDFPLPESFDNIIGIEEVIALIKGEQK
jgi:hypothetical protein